MPSALNPAVLVAATVTASGFCNSYKQEGKTWLAILEKVKESTPSEHHELQPD